MTRIILMMAVLASASAWAQPPSQDVAVKAMCGLAKAHAMRAQAMRQQGQSYSDYRLALFPEDTLSWKFYGIVELTGTLVWRDEAGLNHTPEREGEIIEQACLEVPAGYIDAYRKYASRK